MRLVLTVIALLGTFVATAAMAHSDPSHRIEQLDLRISATPRDASLLLRRGRLHLEMGHADAAARDFERVLELAPDRHGARYFLAESLLDTRQFDAAHAQAARFISAAGLHDAEARARGAWLLGRIEAARGNHVAALDAYDQALAYPGTLTGDQYHLITQAALSAGGGALDRALAVLDGAMRGTGRSPLLQEMAVQLELAAGRTDAALERLDSLIGKDNRRPFLLARRAGILVAADRWQEARAAVLDARAALAGVPANRRAVKAYVELRNTLDELQAALPAAGDTAQTSRPFKADAPGP